MSKRIFTSESVTEGHPDKICDQISDGVLDAILAKDPQARVACECATTTGLVLVMGEITTNCYVDIAGIARDTITKIGYDNAEFGFDGRSCAVLTAIDKQSEDIAMGVDASYDDANQEGAGDQGMMFGFACNETKELMPAPISYAHNLTKALTKARKDGRLPWLRPDGKSQVSVQYGEHGEVERIDTVVVSTQHAADIAISDLREAIVEEIIKPNLPSKLLDGNTKFLVNPTGRFVIGGPVGDSGLTGRKIIVDTYGGYAAHGGGAFSGKDRRRSIGAQLTWRGILRRTSLRRDWLISASWSWRMPSVWRSRCLCSLTATARARCPMNVSARSCASALIFVRRRLSGRSICAGRFISRLRPTATLEDPSSIFRGRRSNGCRNFLQKREKWGMILPSESMRKGASQ